MNAIYLPFQAWNGEKTVTYKYIIMMGPLMIKAIFFSPKYTVTVLSFHTVSTASKYSKGSLSTREAFKE